MDRRPVIVLVPSRRPVSVGLLRLSAVSPSDMTPRLDLQFETDTMRCTMRVPAERMEELAASWNGEMYRYILPSGENIWLRPEEQAEPTAPTAPLIETFPLPDRA
jgi:hypothetical protein